MRSDARTAARLAGALFLIAILIALGGGTVLSDIAGEGSFQQIAVRIAASERLYRAALSSLVIVSLSSALLAFALYATLKSVHPLVAQLAMIFSLGDSFLALVVRMCGFVRLHLYLAAQTAGANPTALQSQSGLVRDIAGVTENIGGICFGIGLLLFFCLFFKSGYIPRVLAVLGLASSAIWMCLYFANLVFPERHAVFQLIYLPPMALTDVLTGFYLMLFGARRKVPVQPGGSVTIA